MIEIRKDITKMMGEEKMKALGGRLMTPEEKTSADQAANKIRFGEKYRKGLRGNALIEVIRLREARPDWQLKDVLADIIKNSNSDMPPAFLLEFTQHIIASWESTHPEKIEKQEPAFA